MKRKISLIVGLLLIINFTMIGCSNNADSGDKSSTEKFKKTTVYNPNTTKVKLIAVSSSRAAEGDEVCEVEPLKSKEVDLGNEHDYYFTDKDGNKIADLSKSDSGEYLPVYLELNEPKDGKQYMLLNQYKDQYRLDSFYRNDNGGYNTFGLLLYEVVNQGDPDAYEYTNDEGTWYIRMYPSANYWIDSKGYATNKIGTIITYDEAFRNNFTPRSNSWVAWGWSTMNTELNMWFCHRVVSYIYHAEDGDTYTEKDIRKEVDISYYNPTNSDITIYDASNNVKTVASANTATNGKIYLYDPLYFMDGTDKVEIEVTKTGYNFVLGCGKPEAGKKYLCLSQYKTAMVEKNSNYPSFYLFEVVDSTAEDAEKLKDSNIYVRHYPTRHYRVSDDAYVNNIIGKEITYTDDMFNQFTNSGKSTFWGWSSQIGEKWYCHFVISDILTK